MKNWDAASPCHGGLAVTEVSLGESQGSRDVTRPWGFASDDLGLVERGVADWRECGDVAGRAEVSASAVCISLIRTDRGLCIPPAKCWRRLDPPPDRDYDFGVSTGSVREHGRMKREAGAIPAQGRCCDRPETRARRHSRTAMSRDGGRRPGIVTSRKPEDLPVQSLSWRLGPRRAGRSR